MKSGLENSLFSSQLPSDSSLPIGRLSAVFRDTTNAYKFYWFRAILSILKEGGGPEISRRDLLERMFEQVWYPLDFYKLSFGKQDGFVKVADFLRLHLTKPIDNAPASKLLFAQIREKIKEESIIEFYKRLGGLYRYVPYQFMTPFFERKSEAINMSEEARIIGQAKEAASFYPASCPYHFTKTGILLHERWYEYFLEHVTILEGFANWHLILFLQRNNPNTFGIAQKLFKPVARNLNAVRSAWQTYGSVQGGLSCIYTGQSVSTDFSLDHYIPWSFVVHDLNWNLAPVSGLANSSKSDRLPDPEYFDRFVKLQYDFFKLISNVKRHKSLLDDYALLFKGSLIDLNNPSEDIFTERFRDTFTPMFQIATNAGFTPGWKYKP